MKKMAASPGTAVAAATASTEECKDDDALTTTLLTCANDPDFAVICSFLQKFAKDLGLQVPNFKHLQEWLTNNDEVTDQLRDLHIKLLRKTRKTVHEKSWESALSKFCFNYSVQDAWEVERFGYKKSSLKVKLRIFRELLESQFERNAKFRAHILTVNADSLRSQPIGRDRLGHSYWLTQDADCNLRIYQEHLDEESWQVVATNRDEFVNLIARLRGNEVVLPSKDIGEADEDTSSSNSCHVSAEKPPPPEEHEDDSHEDETAGAKVPNLKIKLRTPNAESPRKAEPPEPEEEAKTKKVKPLLISQSKLSSSSPAPAALTKKRLLEDVDISPNAQEEQLNKKRPTLLDTKRVKKPSRYESTKSDDENEQESGEEDDDSELDEGEEEEDEEDLDCEEEDIDSAAAEEDENEEKDIEEGDDEVSDAIEEPTLVVRGNGSGRDCKDTPHHVKSATQTDLGCFDVFDEADTCPVGDAIEEPMLFVCGVGNGAECLVGNGKTDVSPDEAPTEAEPKATFFFGEPGCLKLSPMKQTPKQETKRSIFDSISEPAAASTVARSEKQEDEKTSPEKTNGESAKFEDISAAPHRKEGTENNAADESKVEEVTKSGVTAPQNGRNQAEPEPEAEANSTNEKEEKNSESTVNAIVERPESEAVMGPTCTLPEDDVSSKQHVDNKEISTNLKTQEQITVAKQVEEQIVPKDEEAQTSAVLSPLSKSTKEETQKKNDVEVGYKNDVKETSNESPTNESLIKSNESAELESKPSEARVPIESDNQNKLLENHKESNSHEEETSIDTEASKVTVQSEESTNIVEESTQLTSIVTSVEESRPADAKSPEAIQLPAVEEEPREVSVSDQSAKLETASTAKTEGEATESSAVPNPCLEKNIEKAAVEASPTVSAPPNRKRRLADFISPAVNPRHSTTSESEADAHGDKADEDQKQTGDDDDLDVGGKRIKMRPKNTNTEVRRKVEAQKTLIEETTSSSGEEDARSRRKIIAPKRHITAPPLEKPTTYKQKPTLSEIIEKKLKKTPEKTLADQSVEGALTLPTLVTTTADDKKTAAVEISSADVEVATAAVEVPAVAVEAAAAGAEAEVVSMQFTPPKKSPITKPLKKNLLTQIRQEESDEEAIPRKRTNSETVTAAAPPTPEERLSPERQRKRRSSEDIKETTQTPRRGSIDKVEEEPVAVSEKLMRNNEAEPALEEATPTVMKKTTPTASKEATPVREPTPVASESKEATTTAETAVSSRRSGRRGGAAVMYTELPQPKRTRGGAKPISEKSSEAKVEPKEEDEKSKLPESEKLEKQTSKAKSPATTKPSEIKPEVDPKTEPEAKTEVEPEAIKVEQQAAVSDDKTKAEPKNLVSETEQENPDDKEEKPPTPTLAAAMAPTPAKGRGSRKKREVDTTNIIESTDAETPVRQSRRIALQKIKEEAERRKMEEVALRSMKQELKKKKKAEKEADPTVLEPSGESSESESEAEETKKKIKKKCPGKDGWSSDSEEQAESEEEEEEPPHYETDPGSPLFKSDHEFSPESEVEDESVVPMKRARTVRKENADETEAFDADEACQKCGKSDHPEWILLCDTCDKGYHCSCLCPVLFYIPEGDWHCPPCQQEQLIRALEQKLQEFDELVVCKQTEKRLAEEAARLEKERLAEEEREKAARKTKRRDSCSEDYSDIERGTRKHGDSDDDDDENGDKADSKRAKQASKMEKTKRRRGDGRSNRRAAKRGARRRRRGDGSGSDNDSKSDSQSGSSSSGSSGSDSSSYSDSDDEPIYKLRKRRQINVSYRLNEYDDLINSALKKEMDEVAGAGNLGRGKDISTIIEADKEEKARLKKIVTADDEHTTEEVQKQESANKSFKGNTALAAAALADEESESESAEDDENEQPFKAARVKTKAPPAKKKARKLTTLDVSSDEDNGSDEDFKTSSFSDEEDTSISASDESDSSLEVYKRRGRDAGRGKKNRKAARRAARERRKDRKFVVEESDDSEEEQRPKNKKKRKDDSEYTETETDDDDDENGSELSENMDSADLCDDTTSESDDGAWQPSKRKKTAKKPSIGIARKSPKLKKPQVKKPKQLEYSDDDISETEPEEEDDGAPGSGKGSGKQPRTQPLKPTNAGKGKSKVPQTSSKKKKKDSSDEPSDGGGSDDSTRRTRGRRYAYIEDFDDDSSDGGIKPGVKRPDTPPEERQKFIQKQEEIKRMLAEKNAEGAKLAATPRLTPIKGTAAPAEKRTPSKGGDSLSTVPLSVIRQAKVLDIDYLQRKGEAIGDLAEDNMDDVDESEFDDADLPDDLPDDIDAIARMVDDEEQFSAAAARELPAPDEVVRVPPAKAKTPAKAEPAATDTKATHPPASGLQEPMRKRLPMPTIHPPLLRHQFPGAHHSLAHQQTPPGMHPMLQRHLAPPPAMQLLQNALSAPLGQPLNRSNYPPPQQPLPPAGLQRLPLGMAIPHLMHAPAAAAAAAVAASTAASVRTPEPAGEAKPRGRRKKVTPLRDQLQKQQAAAAVTAATGTTTTTAAVAPPTPPAVNSSDKQPTPSHAHLKPPPTTPLFKPHEPPTAAQASVITRMPHHAPLPHARGPPSAMYPVSAELHARFYGQPLPPTSSGASSTRPPTSTVATTSTVASAAAVSRHLLRPQLPPGLPPPSSHSALRPTYGPPPPLRGAPPTSNTGVAAPPSSRPPYLHGPEHHGAPPPGSLAAVYGAGPPPARHASPHLNPYRAPPIYGNPNYAPRVPAPPGAVNMRPPSAVDYVAGTRAYPPYGYYAPPPPLSTPPALSVPSSVIVSAPPSSGAAPTPSPHTNHSVSALTRGKSPAPLPTPPADPHKSLIVSSKKLTTLEGYSNSKSPIADSPGPTAEEDSSSAHGTAAPINASSGSSSTATGGVGEFSGLVSYFSSQQDDYDT